MWIIFLIYGQDNTYSSLYLATEYVLKEGEKEEKKKKEEGKRKQDKNGVYDNFWMKLTLTTGFHNFMEVT